MSSENINYEQLSDSEEITAKSAGSIAFGNVVPVTLRWKDISVTAIKEHRQLLRNVSGVAKPGEVMALMGASGAGKTTLLNMLMCRNLKGLRTEGVITVNGKELGNKISLISGFAQQEEMFIGTLTVQEYLMIQAKIRIDGTSNIREEKVKEVMHQLKLWKCRNSLIGVVGEKKGISGGEARRLTFACEMLSNPSLLFADEPTTGLDSFMAENVIQILRGIAKTGRTIICTIHQPSSQLYQMFDRVIYLANGNTAFHGTPQESLTFFENNGYPCPAEYNPSEWIIYKLAVQPGQELESNARITDIVQKYAESEFNEIVVQDLRGLNVERVQPPLMHKANVWTQFSALLWRCSLDVFRCPSLTRAKIIQKTVFGVFLGLLYFRLEYDQKGVLNMNGAIFFVVGELVYSTCYAIMSFLNNEFPLVAREYHDGLYDLWIYYIARCCSLVPLFTTDALLMLFIVYWLIGLNTSVSQVLVSVLLCIVTSLASSAMGIAMSCIFPTTQMTSVMASPLLVAFRLFAGYFGNMDTFPWFIRWVQWTSMYRYSFEAFLINQWSEIDDFHSEAKTTWTGNNMTEILQKFSFQPDAFSRDLIMLFVITMVLYALGFMALFIRMKKAR